MAEPTPPYRYAGSPPESAMNPMAIGFSNLIEQSAMMRQQNQIAQYEQMVTAPINMSLATHRQIATQPRFQYGVMGGQDQIAYRLREQYSNQSFGAQALATAASFGVYGAGSAAAGGVMGGITGAAAGWGSAAALATGAAAFAGGIAIGAPFIALGNTAAKRARWTHDIASDVRSYSKRFTGGQGFGEEGTKALAGDMMETMMQGGFFDKETQLKMHKMALSGGMLKGTNIEQYKKNFDDLKKNVKDVIMLMNTTMEGGMSIIKELQGTGFSSPTSVKNQIARSKGLGEITGIGAQNMMNIGASAAQASAGTGWQPAVAARFAQENVAITSIMAQNSTGMAQAVTNMGGVANASSALGAAMMNISRSGMGIQTAAYLMDPKTKELNVDRMNRLMSGKVSGAEIVEGANVYGSSGEMGGASNRVLIERDAMRMRNKLNPMQQIMEARGTYSAWAQQRGGINETSAFAFAKMYTQNTAQADLLSQQLIGRMPVGEMRAAVEGQRFAMKASQIDTRAGAFGASVRGAVGGLNDSFNAAADMLGTGAGGALGNVKDSFGNVTRGLGIHGGVMAAGLVLAATPLSPFVIGAAGIYLAGRSAYRYATGKSIWASKSGRASIDKVRRETYSMQNISTQEMDALVGMSPQEVDHMRIKPSTQGIGIDFTNLIASKGKKDIQSALIEMKLFEDNPAKMSQSGILRKFFGAGEYSNLMKQMRDPNKAAGVYDAIINTVNTQQELGGTKAISGYATYLKGLSFEKASESKERTAQAIRDYRTGFASSNDFNKSFKSATGGIPKQEAARVRASVLGDLSGVTAPAYKRFISVSEEEMRGLSKSLGEKITVSEEDVNPSNWGSNQSDGRALLIGVKDQKALLLRYDKALAMQDPVLREEELTSIFKEAGSESDLKQVYSQKQADIKKYKGGVGIEAREKLENNIYLQSAGSLKSSGFKSSDILSYFAGDNKAGMSRSQVAGFLGYAPDASKETMFANVSKVDSNSLQTTVYQRQMATARESYANTSKLLEEGVNSKGKTLDSDEKKDMQAEQDRLLSKMDQLKNVMREDSVNSNSTGMATTVSPPVLNYWDASKTFS